MSCTHLRSRSTVMPAANSCTAVTSKDTSVQVYTWYCCCLLSVHPSPFHPSTPPPPHTHTTGCKRTAHRECLKDVERCTPHQPQSKIFPPPSLLPSLPPPFYLPSPLPSTFPPPSLLPSLPPPFYLPSPLPSTFPPPSLLPSLPPPFYLPSPLPSTFPPPSLLPSLPPPFYLPSPLPSTFPSPSLLPSLPPPFYLPSPLPSTFPHLLSSLVPPIQRRPLTATLSTGSHTDVEPRSPGLTRIGRNSGINGHENSKFS